MNLKLLPIKQYFALIFAILIALNATFATPVSHDLAKQIASNFFIHKRVIDPNNEKNSKVPKIQQVELQEQPFFVFNYDSQQGYAIVASDDCVHPILGYATGGYFDMNNIPPNMQKWLEMYKNEIQYAVSNQLESPPEVISEWQTLMSPAKPKNGNAFQASPILLATQWNQNPYYNDLCPYDRYAGERAVVGCVATAMAQIMKYWNYPATGHGFHAYNHSRYGTLSAAFGSTTYNWANMPNRLTNASTSTQKNAIATLMYHCGVSVDMDYGVGQEGGSSAYTTGGAEYRSSGNALKEYFGYKETLQELYKRNYTNTDWINLLKAELDAGRPMIYGGSGSGGGHAFVCDGYDNGNYFHFNWGWSGQNDGYFHLSALNPGSGGAGGGSYDFTNNQDATIGIEPGDNSGGGGEPAPSTDIQLYSDIEMADDHIWFGDDIEVTVSIGNFATTDFAGQFCAAIFDEDGNFIEYLEIQDTILPARKYRPHTFTNISETVFVPGTYYVAMFYKTAEQGWTLISSSNYSYHKWFEIYYSSNNVEVNSDFTIKTDNGSLIQYSKATINVDVTNPGSSAFLGDFRVTLDYLTGNKVAQLVAVQSTDDDGLAPNYHYTNGLNFTGDITVEPGTYLMSVDYRREGTTQWYYAGSSDYSNPIYVIVEAPEITADRYEPNEHLLDAGSLGATFNKDNAIINITDVNFHIGSDYDYYELTLPAGHDYTITARLHDKYNSGNGEDYTVDALFSYFIEDGDNDFETYDDIMPSNILMSNGGTIYFHVAPYYSGSTGTYLLEIKISRKPITGIDDAIFQNDIKIFPNPASNFITIDLRNIKQNLNVSKIELCDINGKQISSENISNSMKIITLSLESITANGTYFVKIYSDEGIVTKKIVLQKE